MTTKDLQTMTLWQLLEVCDTDPAHVAVAEPATVAQATAEHYGEATVPAFGSAEWFETVDEIPF
jgi:hypothetical protein